MKRRDEVLVGIFVTIAVTVLIVGTIWLTRGGLSRGYPLYAKFEWGQNLKKGHPVLLAGQSVGYVSRVDLKSGYLDVELRIESEVGIPRGSLATVKPVGIFGDVAIAFTPPLPLPTVMYAPGDTVPPGPVTPDIAQIFQRVDSIGGSISRLTLALERDLVTSGGLKDLRRLIASTVTISAQVQAIAVNQDRNLTATMNDFRRTLNKFASLADSAKIDSTVTNIRATSANMARLIAQVDSTNTEFRTLLAKANSGKGSAGMLLNDTALYSNVRNLVARVDSLVNDFTKNPKKYINVQFRVF